MAGLRLHRSHLAALERHAREAAPEESCGVLIGSRRDGGGQVMEVLAARNDAEGDRRNRYSINLRDLFTVHRRARLMGLAVLGYYHSHPRSSAIPSAIDLADALPGASYLIVGRRGGSSEVRSWRLVAGGKFAEESLLVDWRGADR